MWLKRTTPQNIVIGGAAGAVPPLVAWAAVTGGLAGTPLYLFAIVFFWTPPHFWSLSLLMKDEYAARGRADAAGGARRGRDAPPDPALRRPALRASASCPSAPARSGPPTWSARWCWERCSSRGAYRLLRRADRRTALRLYLFSLAYLALLFGAMVADVRL